MSDAFHRARPAFPGLEVVLSSPVPATLLAEVHGDLDIATVPHLHARLADAPGPHRLVVVDLTEVGFLGAAGITALLRLREHTHGHDAAFRVVAAGPALRLLSIVDLLTTLEVHPTRAGALRPA